MKSLPIRSKLTIWNCLLFGTIIAVVISIIYYSHKQAHYREADKMIENFTSYVQRDIEQQLKAGIPLSEVNLVIEAFSINQMAVMIKSNTGELIKTSSHPFFQGHELLDNGTILTRRGFVTIEDENGIRIRTNRSPIYNNGMQTGFLEVLYSLDSLDRSIQRFKWITIALTGFGIAIAAIAGWFLAKNTFRRVDLIGKTAKAIANSQDFEQRVLYIGHPDELGQLTETFNQMLDSLENAYKNQKRFLSDASHELRAPLTTIRGNLDILYKMKQSSEAEKEEILEDIRNEAIRMSKLVSDLLSLARADAGQTIHKDVVDLSKVAAEVLLEIESWKPAVQLEANMQDRIHVWGDRNSLKQILLILLDNAIKYTPDHGSVTLTVNHDHQYAIIKVGDTGIGIKPEEIPSIFERFYRTETARRKSPEGTGLGLSVAKLIIEEHQGTISIRSDYGKGTEFTVYLPLLE